MANGMSASYVGTPLASSRSRSGGTSAGIVVVMRLTGSPSGVRSGDSRYWSGARARATGSSCVRM